MSMKGLHVLLTGASDGIGRALALELDRVGAELSLCGRSAAKLQVVGDLLESDALLHPCDLEDPSCHASLVRSARAKHGPIDMLINNAGVQTPMDFSSPQPPRPIASEVAVNLVAPLLLTEAVLPDLLSQPRGTVVQVTSGLALSPKASSPVYCATKAALRAFTRALRWQLQSTSVRVVEVLPPLVDTSMTRGRGRERSKMTADAVADQVVRALDGRATEVYLGKAKLLRWLVRLMPGLAAAITRRM